MQGVQILSFGKFLRGSIIKLTAIGVASPAAACGHVPIALLPNLMRIDFKTTHLG
jgi:hypothetical protein